MTQPRRENCQCRPVKPRTLSAVLLCMMVALTVQSVRADDPWIMPVRPACVSSPFGWRHAVGPMAPAGFHNGIDMPAPAGGYVYAVAGGQVLMVKKMGLGGLQIELRHPDGLVTVYSSSGQRGAGHRERPACCRRRFVAWPHWSHRCHVRDPSVLYGDQQRQGRGPGPVPWRHALQITRPARCRGTVVMGFWETRPPVAVYTRYRR